MLHIFDMSVGEVEDESGRQIAHIAGQAEILAPQMHCQLRLLTVAEAEEQRPVPRPRPWMFAR